MFTLSASTIASWEAEIGASPIHGLGMELVHGSAIERHQHHRGQIMTAPSGVLSVTAAGKSYVVAGRTGLWIPEGCDHAVAASTDAKMRNLQISRMLAPELPQSISLISISPLFSELLGSAVEGEQWVQKHSREAKILDLLVMEFRIAKEIAFCFPEPRDPRLKRICAALKQNPADSRALSDWSKVAGGCTRTLERLFHKETGMTFAQWRRQLRLQDAVIRLHQGQPVTSIALDTGYDNPSSFIEMFRRLTGRTPGQFLDG
ncbi:helix-turn-helix domain-containing protein [Bradyrhizobium sp. NP1]|jgi:AraC-like DNA-binding protein|uniref:helix-turn-helix domain-containing protein n=1 Tax=Bradyrhizobium sp. NP1 TaxID=3049772 RepID=UPI0025A4DB14|nr:helix-turn-helix domain-containing protein [Bradyrhizobium sp. NP1]WJR78215.1 helix-turn-helix domain-containing protein [Bradyrhizobium sp. NP1]